MPTSNITPMALSAGDNLIRLVWQAEPVEAAISGTTARISAPPRPTEETLRVFAAGARHGR